MPTLNATLPAALILGDSISMGYAPLVRERLNGVVHVVRPEVNCMDSGFGLAHLDEWLGETPWDVIHFNFGLHDLKYLASDGRYVSPE